MQNLNSSWTYNVLGDEWIRSIGILFYWKYLVQIAHFKSWDNWKQHIPGVTLGIILIFLTFYSCSPKCLVCCIKWLSSPCLCLSHPMPVLVNFSSQIPILHHCLSFVSHPLADYLRNNNIISHYCTFFLFCYVKISILF